MESFNNERLKNARLLAGLSLRQLEKALSYKVTYNSINKYEKGQMQPENSTLLKLAEILKVTPAYFFKGSAIELGEISFRKKSTLSKIDIQLIKAKTKDKIERYLEAEKLLNITTPFNNPIARTQVKTADDAEEMAEIVRAAWKLGTNPISNAVEMLEENEVKVIEIDASDKFDGLSTYVDNDIPLAVVNENFTIERKRFTVLHELGHLMMNLKIDEEKEKEIACHRFAGALLFPQSEVRKTLGDKRSKIAMGELVAIKEAYGISAQAAMRRALDLEIIKPLTYNQFFIKLAGNRKEVGLGAYKGEEKSYRLLQMVFRLFAEGVITEAKAASLTGISSTSFRAMFHNISIEDIVAPYKMANAAFSGAWAEDEPEYLLEDIKEINPDYEGW